MSLTGTQHPLLVGRVMPANGANGATAKSQSQTSQHSKAFLFSDAEATLEELLSLDEDCQPKRHRQQSQSLIGSTTTTPAPKRAQGATVRRTSEAKLRRLVRPYEETLQVFPASVVT